MAGGKIFQTKTVDPTDPSIGGKVYQVTQVDPTDPHTQGMVYQVVNVGGGSATIEELNVTPSTSAQTIEATSSVDGYAPVNVAAVTSSIDANIVAGNIKKDVTILGVTGNYEAGGSAVIDPLNVTPSTSAQTITASGGVDGYSPVNVSAVDASIDANITAGNIKSGVTILGVTGNVVELNGETKTVTPQVYGQTLYPTSPKNAITEITVNAVTSSIDANIQAGNIKKDVTILGVTGTYEAGGGSGTPQPNTKKRIVNGLLFADGSELIDLTGVDTISDYALAYAYYGTDITPTVSITNPIVVRSNGMQNMFYRSHFVDPDVDISGISSVAGSGCYYMFYIADIESVDISGITSIGGTNTLAHMFHGCSHLISVNMFNIQTSTSMYGFSNMFENCTALPSIDLSSIETLNGTQICSAMLKGCTALVSADVSYVRSLAGSGVVSSMFSGDTSLASISWDSLRSVSSFGSGASTYIFNGCTGLLEIHFPQNIQPTIEAMQGYADKWGASNATIYFDLPSSYELTGADGNTYYRNPKYDTVTALSWFDVNVGRTTPYYTPKSLDDPVVGATIYSDSDCTTPETTVDSIA